VETLPDDATSVVDEARALTLAATVTKPKRPAPRRKPAAKKAAVTPASGKAADAADAADTEAADAEAALSETDAAAEVEAGDAKADDAKADVVDTDTDATKDSDTDTDTDAAPTDTDEPEATTASAPTKRFGLKRKPVRATVADSRTVETLDVDVALSVEGLTKVFGDTPAVDGIDLVVTPGTFFGIVGPNGAGKTTTLSMITGLLRPDSGVVRVYGRDVWRNAQLAKRQIGVLPDRLRLFDRLTGAEFLYHAGALRGLDRATIAQRAADLSAAFGLEHSLHRLVSDYSVGMTKKIAIAAAMIHAPRLLVLDEPFESVDPVSTDVVIGVLKKFTDAGGTVILSSHSMELTERVCDAIAIIADGAVLAAGPLAEVLGGQSLEDRFVELAGGEAAVEGMEWLQNFSD
jgi:ABC-2 type transport system ATP-binding protein